MAERMGLVLNTFENGTAEVMAEKNSACGGCRDTRNCKSCLSGSDKIVAVVQNTASAGPGDVVRIEHKTNALFGSAALFYGVPVVGLMVGALTGGSMAPGWGMDESLVAVLAAAAGLAIGLLAVVLFTRTEFARIRLVPRIIGTVEKSGQKPVRAPAKAPSRQSCCS